VRNEFLVGNAILPILQLIGLNITPGSVANRNQRTRGTSTAVRKQTIANSSK